MQTHDQGETFGEWQIAQTSREGAIAMLIAGTKADRLFSRSGSPDDVRKRLNEMQADGDMPVVADAETDWMMC